MRRSSRAAHLLFLVLFASAPAWGGILCRDGIITIDGDIHTEVLCMRTPSPPPPIHRPAPPPGGGWLPPSPPRPPSGNQFDRDGDGKLDCWKDAAGPDNAGNAGRGSRTRISSPYGASKSRIGGWHYGVDMVSDTGNYGIGQPVRAIANGVVSEATSNAGNGNYVKINHGDGRATQYLHLQLIQASVKSSVRAGDVIGTMNCTGSCGMGKQKNQPRSTHLHLELMASPDAARDRNGRTDPIAYLGSCK